MRRALVAIAACLLAAACKRDAPAKTTSDPYARKVAEVVPKLEKSIGLRFKTPPRIETRTHDEVRSFLEKKFSEEMPTDELKGIERVYKRLTLLPDTMNLERFMLALLSEQVIGYYDPQPKVLYVVQGSSDENVSLTISHELVHALQDQYFNLDSLQHEHGDNDRTTAAQAVIEGQATLEGLAVMIGGDSFLTRLPGGWDRVRQMIRDAQSSMPVYASAPAILQETLIFPYLSGAEFMRRFKDANPGKEAFDHMPPSTEAVMHEDRFRPGNEDTPTVITLPPAAGGKVVYENNLGEFETRVLLYQWVGDQPTAMRGASGWDGDRYRLLDIGGGQEAFVWLSVWDTSIDAAEFFSDLDIGIVKNFAAKPLTATQTMHAYTGLNGRTLTISVTDIGGRPVVMYTDVPKGASSSLIDVSKVTLKE